MDLAKKILEIRKGNGLTQEEFAEKLFVTRQAASRWENGETTPTVDTLKKMFELFNVDANVFFDVAPVCQSCAWTLNDVEYFGTNPDKSVTTDYCGHCFVDGKFSAEKNVAEMVDMLMGYLKEFNEARGANYTEAEARKELGEYLPTLKRWNSGSVS